MFLHYPFFLTSHWMKNPIHFGIQSSPNTISVKEQCFFSIEFFLKLKAPMAFVCGPHRAALTVVVTSIKGHSLLECKSTMLLMSSVHLPAVLVNICNSTTRNTSGTGQALKNERCFMVFFFLISVYVNNKILCPKWNVFVKIHFSWIFFTRVKVWWKSLCL